MARNIHTRGFTLGALVIGIGLVAAGCSASTPSASTPASAGSGTGSGSTALGTLHKATGTPVVFAVLNLGIGPVTFPEVLQAEQAAVAYVNDYKGGIGGHPIQLVTCQTDGSPATSAQCANKLLDQKPVAVLGAADTGSPGAIPVWANAGLAYLGGLPFTPVEQNSKDAVIFSSASVGDSAAASVYAATTLKAKKAAIIYTSDTQGAAIANGIVAPTMKNAGIGSVTKIAIPPTASDVSSAVATAVGGQPDVIFIDAPAACPNIMASLKQLGNNAKIMGIAPCTSPQAIAGANGGAEGLYFASPTVDPGQNTKETALFLAALGKYAPKDMAVDGPAAVGFQTVINVQAALATFTTADLTTAKILAAFRTGSAHPNFLGHPYTCDGKQVIGASAICDGNQQIYQVKDGKPVATSTTWLTAGSFYVPQGQ